MIKKENKDNKIEYMQEYRNNIWILGIKEEFMI